MKGARSAPASTDRRSGWLPLVLLAALTVLAYLPSLANGFVWDDDVSLTQNPFIQAGEGLREFWFTTQTPDYWPVTSTTLWAEWRLWGMDPLGYHITNLSLHVAEVLLLAVILRRLRLPGAFLAALLFAVHPVNAETVAWITQRKNLMAMLFCLISVYCFLRSGRVAPAPTGGREGDHEGRNIMYLGLSLLAFVLAMLSKGSVAVLPVILAGLIAWHRRIVRSDMLRLLPFFGMALVLTLVDIWFQGHHLAAAEAIRTAGATERVLGAATIVWFYLYKALLPIHLILPYPLWRIDARSLVWWLPLIGAVAATALLWAKSRAGNCAWRAALFAWGFFCVALIPVMGFTDVYFMKFSLVADHYQHLALIGVTALAGAGWGEWHRREPGAVPLVAAAAVVCLLGGLTWRECLRYRGPETFFTAAVRENPASPMVQGNLGMVLGSQRRISEAMTHLEEALRLDPDYAEARVNLGALLVEQGRIAEGEAQYEAALRLKPDLFVVRLNLGSILLSQGRLPEAREELRAAVQLKPSFAAAHAMLGEVCARLDELPEAIAQYETALRLEPNDAATQGWEHALDVVRRRADQEGSGRP